MTLAEDLKPVMDDARSIAGTLGFRLFAVTVRKRAWSGARVGLGTATTTDTALTAAHGANPKVRYLSQREIIASAGLYQALDLEVTLTADYSPVDGYGGVAIATLSPVPTSAPTEVLFKVTGPGLPSAGGWFKMIGLNANSALTYKIILRNTGMVDT
jgi:hypothetical protein